jgi:hypothetical protein
MDLLELAAGALKKRGTRLVASWLAVTFIVALIYRAFGDGPLRGAELTGLSLTAAVAVLAVSEITRWTRRRRRGDEAAAPSPSPSGGDHHDESH